MNDMTTTAHAVTLALALYEHNVPRSKQIEALFPDSHPNYINAKIEALRVKGLIKFMGELDEAKQRQYVSNALDAYADEAFRRADRAACTEIIKKAAGA